MIIKLNVINMNEFLKTVSECVSAVKIIDSNGKKCDITRQDEIQLELRRRYHENKNYLKLALEISNPKDYMKIVLFTIGDC